MKDGFDAVNSSVGFFKQVEDVLKIFEPYKPVVKRFRIDYLDRSSEIKYLLHIPPGIRRLTKRIVELPATTGFIIDEVFDLDIQEMQDVVYIQDDKKYVVNAKELSSSEYFLITLKGRVSNEFLNSLVTVNCAVNPTRVEEDDCYWVHSALKDVSILERVWDELNVDRVNADVKIGVERLFSSTIPKDIRDRLAIQKRLLDAIASRERNRARIEYEYRRALVRSRISPRELYDLIVRLSTGEYFSQYIMVDDPFKMGIVEPLKETASLIPNAVKVEVSTDLNFQIPAVQGNLVFKRGNYETSIEEEIQKLEKD